MAKIEINGAFYYTRDEFAALTGKHVNTISTFLDHGNAIRVLKHIDIGGKPLILASELLEYPFTQRGPNSKHRVYHYTADGTMHICVACSAAGEDVCGRE